MMLPGCDFARERKNPRTGNTIPVYRLKRLSSVRSRPGSAPKRGPARRLEPVVLGEPFPLASVAAGLVRQAAPADFPVDEPVYLAAHSAVPGFDPEIDRPWGAVAADPERPALKRPLQAYGAYRGPGFAAVFRDGWIAEHAPGDQMRQFRKGLAITIHEAGHYLERRRDHRAESERGGHWIQAGDQAMANYYLRPGQRQRAYRHGPSWIRATLHLWYRVQRIHAVALADCDVAGRAYGLSDPDLYKLALAGELQGRINEPIGAILRDDPPRMFAEFYYEDARRNGAG